MIEFTIKLRVNPKKELLEIHDLTDYEVVDRLEECLVEILEDEIVTDEFDEVDWEITNKIYE